MSDETKHVTPDAPRPLTWWETAKAVFPNSRSMTREEAAEFRILSHKGAKKLYREEDWKAAREKAVRDFATFLATTASPKGTVQREKLQSFATEFLEGR